MRDKVNLNLDIKHSLVALEGIDKVQEELRLAFTNPSYESYTSKMVRTLRFFQMLNYLIKKEVLLYTYFLIERKKALDEILAKIKSEEKYALEQEKSQRESITPFVKAIDIEVTTASKNLSELLEKKINDIEIFVEKTKDKIANLSRLKIVLKTRIAEDSQDLRIGIQEKLGSIPSEKQFALILSKLGDKQFIITSDDIKKEIYHQTDQKISDLEMDFSHMSVELITNNIIHKKYQEHFSDQHASDEIQSAINYEENNPSSKKIILELTDHINQIYTETFSDSKISGKITSLEKNISALETVENRQKELTEQLSRAQENLSLLKNIKSSTSSSNLKELDISSASEKFKLIDEDTEKLNSQIETELAETEKALNNSGTSLNQQIRESMDSVDVSELLANMDLDDLDLDLEMEAELSDTEPQATPNEDTTFDTTQMLLNRMQHPPNENKPAKTSVNDKKYPEEAEKTQYKNDAVIDKSADDSQDTLDNKKDNKNEDDSRLKP